MRVSVMDMDALLVVLVVSILAVQFILFYKLRKLHLASFRMLAAADETFALFKQFQAYDGLKQLIEPSRPLPLLRGWAASPDLLFLLAQDVLKHKPQALLECSSGVSTLVLARCCQLNGSGHVYSLEHDERFAQETCGRLADHGLGTWATVIHAPLIPAGESGQPWYDLDRLIAPSGGFDMLVIDGPPASTASLARYPALPRLDKLLKSGARIFLDDARREGEQQALGRWKTEFPNYSQVSLNLDKGCAVLIKS